MIQRLIIHVGRCSTDEACRDWKRRAAVMFKRRARQAISEAVAKNGLFSCLVSVDDCGLVMLLRDGFAPTEQYVQRITLQFEGPVPLEEYPESLRLYYSAYVPRSIQRRLMEAAA